MTLFGLLPIYMTNQFLEVQAMIRMKKVYDPNYENEAYISFITNLHIFRSVVFAAVVCLTTYFIQLEFAYLVIDREMIKKE